MTDKLEEKRGLWDNIHAKRERIKHGSGEHMRRQGEKGRPTAADFRASQVKEAETPTAEPQSSDKNKSSSRFDATTSLDKIYRQDTPGQKGSTLKTVKRVVREALYHGKQVPLNKPMKGDVKKSKVYVKRSEEHTSELQSH